MAGLSFNQCVTAGHEAWPPTVINATQGKVFTGGIPVLVAGDPITEHTEIKKPYETFFKITGSSIHLFDCICFCSRQ